VAIPATSLDASTEPATGTSVSLGAAFSKHNALFTITNWSDPAEIGSSCAVGLYLDGSFDGENWFTVAQATAAEDCQVLVAPPVNSPVQLALYLRARWAILTGTPAATVTAVIASAA
jgi:hypothetical protein